MGWSFERSVLTPLPTPPQQGWSQGGRECGAFPANYSPQNESATSPHRLSPLAREIVELRRAKRALAKLERGPGQALEMSPATPLPNPPPQGGRGRGVFPVSLR